MRKKLIQIFMSFLFPLPFLFSGETNTTLNTLIEVALASDRPAIQARQNYQTSLIDQKYNYLQWWVPSFGLTNDFIYPYENDEFDDVFTGDTTSLSISLPLPTGASFNLSSSYALSRELLDDSLPDALHWGLSQNLSGKIGLSQSLNPWWLHLKQNPYKNRANIQYQTAKNSYSIAVKNTLLTCIQNYISLREAERNKKQLADTLAVYDELMDAYQKMQSDGNISWRDFYDIRNDKWEYEQDLFALENELNTIRGNIFQVTGIQAANVHDEPLPEITDTLFMQLFLGFQKSEVSGLEERNIYLQMQILQIGKILDRQSNAPKLKIDFGTSYQLPAQKTGDLKEAWKKENFDDNKLNNWTVSVGLDLSNLFTPLDKKNALVHDIEINTLNELLKTIDNEKEKQKTLAARMIRQLQEQIAHLSAIVQTEEKNIQEDEKMKTRGVITELEYRQSALVYSEKYTLLQNLKDELWLYQFIESFYL